ncbi:uncharacterized protein LOC106158710 isoform X2 [Lingula anatina]|uniref:Uncharacterized protein LOC106158710 isoform X2 n=1 Tax=Lingula anatina TaxID=7574 RepID=A0A1S3HYT4_LINAN|nr:uncharacterized protein LOC106158710 isoform X2 [Lingula anatina]|eukprot:XP_013390244.1 uncharacterized protein LOC106158710 isoform X2 [Lingula anatina]
MRHLFGVFITALSCVIPIVQPEVLKWRPYKIENEVLQAPADFVKRVHVIYMNHLDVGYDGLYPKEIGFINNVLNKYFVEYFPRAVQLADTLRKGGHNETFIYTTHPWLVSLYMDCPQDLVLHGIRLQCPNASARAHFIAAVQRGDITWHAGPMNMQAENSPLWLFNFGLDLGADLDKLFGIVRKYRTMSQRDVPGLTHAAIPSLVEKGIKALTVGVNDMSAPPDVPHPLFRWQYGKAEVLATWHPGGYPDDPGPTPKLPRGLSRKDCVVVTGFPDAMCFAFRTDNSGPPVDIKEIKRYFSILQAEFPNAVIKASNLETFMATIEPIKAKLPVVTKEIGDTWIQGTASDPRKQAEYRAIARVLGICLERGQCSLQDHQIYNASRFLLKLGEHTWGLSTEWDFVHWTNAEFGRFRSNKNFTDCENSWREQRSFSSVAMEAMAQHVIIADVEEELAQLRPAKPHLEDFEKIDLTRGSPVFKCKNLDLQFGSDGALTLLIDHRSGVQWADVLHPLGQFKYVTYNETDFVTFNRQYAYNISRNVGIMKINCSKYAHPESKPWHVDMVQLYKRKDFSSCEFYVQLHMRDYITQTFYGAPKEIWLHYTEDTPPGGQAGLNLDLQWFDKTVTRLPEALMFSFTPRQQRAHQWRIKKLGRWIDPLNLVQNGSSLQHVIDDVISYTKQNFSSGIQIASVDAPLVAPSAEGKMATPFPAPLTPLKTIDSMSFILYNNIWGTNYIFWYPYLDEDKDFKARFQLKFLR